LEGNGESAGARTQDQRLKRAMLYQLSYALKPLYKVSTVEPIHSVDFSAIGSLRSGTHLCLLCSTSQEQTGLNNFVEDDPRLRRSCVEFSSAIHMNTRAESIQSDTKVSRPFIDLR
jgi:hypothetical protein